MASVAAVLPLPVPLLDDPPELPEPPEPKEPNGESPDDPPKPKEPNGESPDEPLDPEDPEGDCPVEPFPFDEPDDPVPELAGVVLLAAVLAAAVCPGHNSWPTPTPARAATPSTAALASTKARRGRRWDGGRSLLDPEP
jgi:hypothetical protein